MNTEIHHKKETKGDRRKRRRCNIETPCIAIFSQQKYHFLQKWRTGRQDRSCLGG
jgi:hypothetical protein